RGPSAHGTQTNFPNPCPPSIFCGKINILENVVLARRLYLKLSYSRPERRAAEKPRLRVDDYQIDVELLPQTHKLSAHATVKVTALGDLSVASFQLNNALRITKLTDANNKALTPERN